MLFGLKTPLKSELPMTFCFDNSECVYIQRGSFLQCERVLLNTDLSQSSGRIDTQVLFVAGHGLAALSMVGATIVMPERVVILYEYSFYQFQPLCPVLLLLAPFQPRRLRAAAVKDPEHTTELLQRFDNIVADPEARQKANAQGQERAVLLSLPWQKR